MPGGSQNAVTGRNRSVLVSFRLSHRPLRSELQTARTRKPFQPVKLLSLPDTLHVLSPSLRFCISGFHNQKSSYHISARFASAEADFMAIFRFRLCFPPGYGMLSATFYWKEGAPTWVGTAAFSSKKETLKHFRLEVRPFLGITLSVCCAASSPEGGGSPWHVGQALRNAWVFPCVRAWALLSLADASSSKARICFYAA